MLVLIKYTIVFMFVFYAFYAVNKHRINVIYVLPLIFILLEILKNIFFEFSIEYGFNGIQNGIIIIIIVYLLSKIYNYRFFLRYSIIIMLFLIYMFYNIPYSIDFVSSATKSLGLINSLLLIPISATIIKNEDDLNKLNQSLIFTLKIYVVYLIIASIFKFGPNHYDTDLIYGLRFEQYYFGSIALVIMPLIIPKVKSLKKKRVLYLLSFITFMILLLTLRRTAIIIIILGLILYYVYLPRSKKSISYLFSISFILIFIAIIVNSSSIVDYRTQEFTSGYNIEDEGRYIEMELVLYTLISNSNYNLLTGSRQFLEDAGKYNYKGDDRPIHGAFAKILFGGGFIGLFLFLFIFVRIFLKAYVEKNNMKYGGVFAKDMNSYRAMLMALVLVFLAVAFTGGIGVGTGIGFTGTTYIYIGALSGILFRKKVN